MPIRHVAARLNAPAADARLLRALRVRQFAVLEWASERHPGFDRPWSPA